MSDLHSRSASGMLIEEVDGIKDFLHYDETGKKFHHEIIQDVEPTLEYAKALAREDKAGVSQSGDLRYAGSFPRLIVMEWLRLRGLTMNDMQGDVVAQFLNDPAHSDFRIWKGRV